MSHWTYSAELPNVSSDLAQGDIIGWSGELREILRQIHSHFCDDKYLGFIVTTQTCDLATRNDGRKEHPITLAVIRPLAWYLQNHLGNSTFAGVFPEEKRGVYSQLLDRVLNQNEQSLGLFYLHPDADVGIAEPSVAMLRVLFSLKDQHYGVLQRCRTGRLQEAFSAKLGWLAGNLFSRVATRDWEEAERKSLVSLLLDANGNRKWVSGKLIGLAEAAGVKHSDSASLDDLVSEIKRHSPKSSMDAAMEAVQAEATALFGPDNAAKITKLCSRLRSSQKFSGCIKK